MKRNYPLFLPPPPHTHPIMTFCAVLPSRVINAIGFNQKNSIITLQEVNNVLIFYCHDHVYWTALVCELHPLAVHNKVNPVGVNVSK